MSKDLIEKILNNSATQAQIDQFNIWLQQSENNQAYFEQSKIIWTRLDGVYTNTEFNFETAITKINQKVAKQTISLKTTWRFRLTAAAIFLILLGISSFFYYQSIRYLDTNYFSGDAIKEINLKDGTKVWLNKKSTLTVAGNFLQDERNVYLKGEAYFEVKRNEAKPFKVFSGITVTEVLGTSFNIAFDTLTGDVNLDVKTGKVAFYKLKGKNGNQYLLAGEQAQYLKNENAIKVIKKEDFNYLAWKTGELKFYETPLQQVCFDLSKYYGSTIKTNIDNCDLTLTGTFRNDDIIEILKSIELTLDVKINFRNQIYTIEKEHTNP